MSLPDFQPGPAEPALAALTAQVAAGLAMLADKHAGFVLTLEANEDERLWVQVADDLHNASWPFNHEPEPMFPAICGSELVDFKPGLFATFSVPDTDTAVRARWIAHYFVEILGCDTTATLSGSVEDQS